MAAERPTGDTIGHTSVPDYSKHGRHPAVARLANAIALINAYTNLA